MYIGAIRKDLLSAPLHVLDKRGYRQILTSKEWLDNICSLVLSETRTNYFYSSEQSGIGMHFVCLIGELQ